MHRVLTTFAASVVLFALIAAGSATHDMYTRLQDIRADWAQTQSMPLSPFKLDRLSRLERRVDAVAAAHPESEAANQWQAVIESSRLGVAARLITS